MMLGTSLGPLHGRLTASKSLRSFWTLLSTTN